MTPSLGLTTGMTDVSLYVTETTVSEDGLKTVPNRCTTCQAGSEKQLSICSKETLATIHNAWLYHILWTYSAALIGLGFSALSAS
jgi:hypothetical protein